MPSITYTITPSQYDEFKNIFLSVYPVPLDVGGTPIMSEGDWIKEWGKQQFISAYKRGKLLEAQKNLILMEGWIT